MDFRKVIETFPEQLKWTPILEEAAALEGKKFSHIAVLGMGGSHLAGDLLKAWRPAQPLISHHDYGYPSWINKTGLVVAASYSGNTEEVLDGARAALAANLTLAVIASGGELLKFARDKRLPRVALPQPGVEPRMASGYAFRALLAIIGEKDALHESQAVVTRLDPHRRETEGEKTAAWLEGRTALIYASSHNASLANLFKIQLNETAKLPAFANTVPELCHNEIESFPRLGKEGRTAVIVIEDAEDDSRLTRRLTTLAEIAAETGLPARRVELGESHSRLLKIFDFFFLAAWTAFFAARDAGEDPQVLKLIPEFKRRMSRPA